MIKFPINYFCHFDRSEKHLCFISKVCFQMWNAIYRIESTMEFELLAHGGCWEMGGKIGMHFLLLYIWIPNYIKVYDKLMHYTCSCRNQLPASRYIPLFTLWIFFYTWIEPFLCNGDSQHGEDMHLPSR